MPPFRTPETLKREVNMKIDEAEIRRNDEPPHQAVIRRARDILKYHGKTFWTRHDDPARNQCQTAWYENTDLRDDGSRTFYRLVQGLAPGKDGECVGGNAFAIRIKTSRPHPFERKGLVWAYETAAYIGAPCNFVRNDATIESPGVCLSGPTPSVALERDSEQFTTVVDTLEFIAAAAEEK